MALTRIKPKFQITIPQSARTLVGLKVGDLLDATPTRGGIMLRPKVVVDMDKVELDKRFAEAEADVKAGRVLGPFKTAGAAMRALNKRVHARRVH